VTLRSRVRAIGAAVAAWIFFVYVSDLGTIGVAIARGLSAAQVFALALINPVEEARVVGTLALTSRPDVLGPAGLYAIDLIGRAGTLALGGALLGASAAALVLFGHLCFRKAVIS
jgi:hypothetical protein